MSTRPTLTNAARPSTFMVDAIDEHGIVQPTPIAGEHPLTIYVDKREILTIMTLGAAPEALVIGKNFTLVHVDRQRMLARNRGGLHDAMFIDGVDHEGRGARGVG